MDFYEKTILIYRKGTKERRSQIANEEVLAILQEYRNDFRNEIENCHYFFVNQTGKPLSDKTVRRMINKYVSLAAIELHIATYVPSYICNKSFRS